MKAFVLLPILIALGCSLVLTLCGCENESQMKLENCKSVYQLKEVNTTSTAKTFGPTEKVAIRLGFLFQDLRVQKIMLRAWNLGNTAIRVDFYQNGEGQDPDAGIRLGGTEALAESSPTTESETWFRLVEPVTLTKSDESLTKVAVVLTFGGGITVDYGATSGSTLRSDYTTNTFFSWGPADRSNGISFGYESDSGCR